MKSGQIHQRVLKSLGKQQMGNFTRYGSTAETTDQSFHCTKKRATRCYMPPDMMQ